MTQHSERPSETGRIGGVNHLSKSQTEMGAKFKKDQKVELKEVQSEIRTIKAVFPLIKQAVYKNFILI